MAKLAQVDISLVSRVLNDHPKASASPATRERIIEAASSLDYSPNVVARGLRMSRTWTLGLMLPNFSNPMYGDIAQAAEERARERGFGLVVGTHLEGAQEATFARLLEQGRVDGLLIASGILGDAFLRRVVAEGDEPVVLLNRRVRGIKPAVTVDDAASAALATSHLIQLGHRHIAGIFGPSEIDTSRRRRKGFMRTAEDAGTEFTIVEATGWDAAAGRTAAKELFAELSTVTAVVASSFGLGVGTLRAAAECDLEIPRDASIIALHDSQLADYLNPRLTTVELPVAEMAHRAVDTLIEVIDGADAQSSMIRIKPRIIERDSTSKR